MTDAGISAYPFWKDNLNQDFQSSDYLPTMSGMILSNYITSTEVWVTGGSVTNDPSNPPEVFTIPVPDDYVDVGYPVNIKVDVFGTQRLDYTFVLEQSNVLGSSPVTGIRFDCPINNGVWNYTSTFQNDWVTIDKNIIIASGVRQVNGFDDHLVLYHGDIPFTVGDVVVVDSDDATSAASSASSSLASASTATVQAAAAASSASSITS